MEKNYTSRFDGENLVIKCSKDCHIYNTLLLIFISCLGVLAYFEFDSELTAIIIVGPALLVLLRGWIVVGKTIIMNKEQCTVRFLWGSQTYKWNELKTKKIVDFSRSISIATGKPYIAGAVFSPGYVRNPFRLMPIDYNVFNIFSNGSIYRYFFVYFDPHIEYRSNQPDVYVVEETEFTALMKEWNVDIEDTRKNQVDVQSH